MSRAWRGCCPKYRALSSTVCLWVSSVWPCLRVRREFALLNGRSAAIEEIRNEESFEEPCKNCVCRGPCVGTGCGRRSSRGAVGSTFPGGTCLRQGNSDDEDRQQHV